MGLGLGGLGLAQHRGAGSGGGGPTTYLSDTFTAANGTAVAGRTMSPGPGAWDGSAVAGTWTVDTDKAKSDGTGGSRVVAEGGVADNVVFSAKVTVQRSGSPLQGLVFRHVDSDNDLNLVWDQLDSAYLTVRTTAGGETTAASVAKVLSDGSEYVFQVTLSGNSIAGLVDGTAVNHTTATHNTATKFGVRLGSGTTNRVDDFLLVSS